VGAPYLSRSLELCRKALPVGGVTSKSGLIGDQTATRTGRQPTPEACPESSPEVLGLYLERPCNQGGRGFAVFGGALRIQRLEGSHPGMWESMYFE